MSSFVPSAITQSFFELQTPDFTWKFVWTVTNYEKTFKRKWPLNITLLCNNSAIFQGTESRFYMEVRMDCPNNL